jgi:hypothetical protein
MAASKKYFHDHLVLLLLSINAFLAIAGSIFVLASLSSGHSSTYIVQCRDCSNTDAVNKFTNGGVVNLLSFVAFMLLVLATHVMLSFRTYRIHRQVTIAILSLGTLLLVLSIIVANSLLVLR